MKLIPLERLVITFEINDFYQSFGIFISFDQKIETESPKTDQSHSKTPVQKIVPVRCSYKYEKKSMFEGLLLGL